MFLENDVLLPSESPGLSPDFPGLSRTSQPPESPGFDTASKPS
jgi:hypothetical protein